MPGPGNGLQAFRIIESPPEASLHPRAIWNHWKSRVILDPRTYYGLVECLSALVFFLSVQGGRARVSDLCAALLLLVVVIPLHWFSTHRTSSHFMTRAKTHVAALVLLATILFGLQITSLLGQKQCGNFEDMCGIVMMLLWACFILLLFTAYLVYMLVRYPRKDPLLAELPSPIDLEENEAGRVPWSSADVAEGIEDDSPEVEGQVRL